MLKNQTYVNNAAQGETKRHKKLKVSSVRLQCSFHQ